MLYSFPTNLWMATVLLYKNKETILDSTGRASIALLLGSHRAFVVLNFTIVSKIVYDLLF